MADTLPAEAIEAAAEALYTADYRNGEPFAKYPVGSYWGDRYRSEAHAALLAALPPLARLAAVPSEQEPVAYLIEDSPVRGIRAIVWPGELQRAMEEEPQAKTTPLYAHPAEAKADDRPDPTPDAAFAAWVASLPKESWAKYDLSACRLGWDAARRAAIPSEQGEAVLPRAEDGRIAPPLEFGYTNWRGEFSQRCAVPIAVRFGSTEWHPEPQWLLTAWDAEKAATRDFAMRDLVLASHPAPAAGVKVPFAVFGQEAIDAAMENERTAQQFRDDLVASPSPPALDGAGRDAVIEEIAKWLEEQAEADFTMAEDTPEYSPEGYRLMLRRKWRKADAAAIRALKETR